MIKMNIDFEAGIHELLNEKIQATENDIGNKYIPEDINQEYRDKLEFLKKLKQALS
jgi:hypothetical protein